MIIVRVYTIIRRKNTPFFAKISGGGITFMGPYITERSTASVGLYYFVNTFIYRYISLTSGSREHRVSISEFLFLFFYSRSMFY